MIKLPVIFNKMTPRADRSWSLVFETRELNGQGIKDLADSLGIEGWLVYSENADITSGDIPEVNADSGLDLKSPSQRLRNTMYVRWEQAGKPDGSFDKWYLTQMERHIELEKSKLNK